MHIFGDVQKKNEKNSWQSYETKHVIRWAQMYELYDESV